jgi:pyrimidine-nucleoside phosphorylase
MIRPAELIERKRNGAELAPEDVSELVLAYARDEVPDYQMAAFCMAVCFRGLSPRETHAMTTAMVASGDMIDLAPLGRKVVDKHSTGGVGDKTSIALGPLVAACGVPFAKMSGRGLGHTGGTLDKLESIPGFRVELDRDSFIGQVRDVGVAIIGQSADLVPADRKLYALRDVTATISNVSLIAASIMSKKIAGGADAIVLDVKVGDGAFMRSAEEARELAVMMIEIGRLAGREVVCELTDMDQPLGRAVGNALEVREAVETLRGEGPDDLSELVLGATADVLALSDLDIDRDQARQKAVAAIETGAALSTYERWVAAQGGDPAVDSLPSAPVTEPVRAPREGYVERIATSTLGRAVMHLGAGRATKDDTIDHAVGVVCVAKRGERVEKGDPLAYVHARDGASARRAVEEVAACYALAPQAPQSSPLVLDVLR